MRKFYGVLGGVIALSSVVVAQQSDAARKSRVLAPAKIAPATPKVALAESMPKGTVLINCPNPVVWEDDNKIGHATKDVTISQTGEDFILNCDDLIYNKKTNQALARQKLSIESRDSTITGDLIHADFDSKVITITGNVVLHSRGADDGIHGTASSTHKHRLPAQLRGKTSTMTCDKIDYNYENHEATVTGHIHMAQEGNSGTCDRILFDDDNNIARMVGNVAFTNADHQTFKVSELTIWIDSSRMQTSGASQIIIPQGGSKNTKPQPPKTKFLPAPQLNLDKATADELARPYTPPDTAPATPGTPTEGTTGTDNNKDTPDDKAAPAKSPSSPVNEEKAPGDAPQPQSTRTAER